MRQLKAVAGVFWGLCLAGCASDFKGDPIPDDRPFYPASLAQKDDVLFVVSTNFDRRYASGSVLTLDLSVADALLGNPSDVILPEAIVTSSARVPTFGDGLLLPANSDAALLVEREISGFLGLPTQGKSLACGAGSKGQDCLKPLLSLPQQDPYHLFPLTDVPGQIEGIIGYLNGPRVDGGNPAAGTNVPFELQRFTWNSSTNQVELGKSIALGQAWLNSQGSTVATSVRYVARISGIKAVQRPLGDFILVAVEMPGLGTSAQSSKTVRILAVPKSQMLSGDLVPNELGDFNVTTDTNAESVRALVLMNSGGEDYLYVLTARPSMIVRLKLVDVPAAGTVPAHVSATFLGAKATCSTASALAKTPNDELLIVSCYETGNLLAYEPDSLSLVATTPISGLSFGRGPEQILFDARKTTPPYRFYVSYFLDGSIGAFDVDPSLITSPMGPVGRIFLAAPLNQRGGI